MGSSSVEKKAKKKKRELSDDEQSLVKEKKKLKKMKKNKKEKKEKKKLKKEKKSKSKNKEEIRDEDVEGVNTDGVTLLLFYQYVEPVWTPAEYKVAFEYAEKSANKHNMTGRMRVAKEGFNCTLTGEYHEVRAWCKEIRKYEPLQPHFNETEFKLTDNLPEGQMFPKLNVFHVQELVNYGLEGKKAPPISKTGDHLEPEDYHAKMAESDTVIIDVRNHYEAAIGHFTPPDSGAQMIDPKMRKSTEFPVWLDKPETKEKLAGKQVLMYCTGGVRCERASALLRQRMETDEEVKDLNIKGVYQLQGGIDKYFKKFPSGGYWQGKNYTFDKRFAHVPTNVSDDVKMGKCEACAKPWDMYRGKRRCPTCGVPSLICRECFDLDKNKIKKLDKSIRCVLCVEQNITSKFQIKQREIEEMEEYARKQRDKKRLMNQAKDNELKVEEENQEEEEEDDDDIKRATETKTAPAPSKHATNEEDTNPEKITRLFVKNMCNRQMDQDSLCDFLPNITHIMWLTDRITGRFYGSAFVEMATPEDAAYAVSRNGEYIFNRPIMIKYHKADGKDVWPPENCAI